MRRNHDRESGQAAVEFALFGLLLLALTVGLVDTGRAAYSFISISAAARYSARWGSVEGGTCGDSHTTVETAADWCNALGTVNASTTPFWSQYGNFPLQGATACPAGYDKNFANYYTLASLAAGGGSQNTTTTIAGSVLRHLDTTSGSASVNAGNWAAGLDPGVARVCIQLPSIAHTSGTWKPVAGDTVTVYVYYPFKPASGLLGRALSINLTASSQYTIE